MFIESPSSKMLHTVYSFQNIVDTLISDIKLTRVIMSDNKKPKMSSLEQLRASGTLVVADTGDFEAIAKFKPR